MEVRGSGGDGRAGWPRCCYVWEPRGAGHAADVPAIRVVCRPVDCSCSDAPNRRPFERMLCPVLSTLAPAHKVTWRQPAVPSGPALARTLPYERHVMALPESRRHRRRPTPAQAARQPAHHSTASSRLGRGSPHGTSPSSSTWHTDTSPIDLGSAMASVSRPSGCCDDDCPDAGDAIRRGVVRRVRGASARWEASLVAPRALGRGPSRGLATTQPALRGRCKCVGPDTPSAGDGVWSSAMFTLSTVAHTQPLVT